MAIRFATMALLLKSIALAISHRGAQLLKALAIAIAIAERSS